MLDPKRYRESADAVRARLAQRNLAAAEAFDAVASLDAEWRAALARVEALKAERNKLSKEVGQRKSRGESADDLLARTKSLGDELTALDQANRELEARLQAAAMVVPNLPHESVPAGTGADDNTEVSRWGDAPVYDFAPRGHVELAEALGIIDFEVARKISGAGFAVYRGAGARLERGLIAFLLDLHTRDHGYEEVSPPFLVARHSMEGTGQLPKFEEDMYAAEDGLFLLPTAEVALTNLVRDELLPAGSLPRYFAGYTPCFRKEAGSSGRDTRGLIRMHQFDKVELVKICRPETSYDELERMRADAERVLQLLGLHHRTLLLCTGDMGFGATKCYDIEVWAPGEGRFLEVSSCSNCEDFQARRMNLRFKDEQGKNHPCHTLNGSGTALARLVVALLETYQRADGSIELPEILEPYVGTRILGQTSGTR
jgi:seryl-tRNA synthetase